MTKKMNSKAKTSSKFSFFAKPKLVQVQLNTLASSRFRGFSRKKHRNACGFVR